METTPSPFILQSGHCGDMVSWTSHRDGWSSRGWGGTGHSTGTHCGRWFPSGHDADQREVLGLVAAEGGWHVRGHHFDGGGGSYPRGKHSETEV